jgi:hypothetical protein
MCCGEQNERHTTPFYLCMEDTGEASGLCMELSLYLVSRNHVQNERVRVAADEAWLITGFVLDV